MYWKKMIYSGKKRVEKKEGKPSESKRISFNDK